MIAEQIMHTNLHTISPTNTVREGLQVMREHKIRHLPVVNERMELIGLVTEHDIKAAAPSNLLLEPNFEFNNIPLEKIMRINPIIAHPLDFVEEIALTLFEAKIGCIPIVSGGILVGIVTTSDLLYTYIELTGATIPGSKIEIRVRNRPGLLYEITEVFKAHNANVINVLVYAEHQSKTHSIVSVRIRIVDPTNLIEALRAEGFHVLWPNVPGITV